VAHFVVGLAQAGQVSMVVATRSDHLQGELPCEKEREVACPKTRRLRPMAGWYVQAGHSTYTLLNI
jgi:hypothetical protein